MPCEMYAQESCNQCINTIAHSVYFDMPDPAFGIQLVYNRV